MKSKNCDILKNFKQKQLDEIISAFLIAKSGSKNASKKLHKIGAKPVRAQRKRRIVFENSTSISRAEK
jgi:hypothetical protein